MESKDHSVSSIRISDDGREHSRENKFHRPWISYEALVWTIYTIVTVLFIADRFTTNVLPRQTFHIGQGTAGGDKMDGLKAGPWSVQLYDILARTSGRFSIVALNLLFFTRMETFHFWLWETWPAQNLVDFSDSIKGNLRLHKWNGIAIVVMTLLHVWSIVFPCIFHGWKAKVVLGSFEWILSERAPKGFKDANVDTQTMSLQGDDVFRLIEMTIFLAILLPLSIHWLATRWHLGIHLHGLLSILYFIDIVRRHTHPHSWVFNTPFFVAWIADLTIGFYWRKNRPELNRVKLSKDYIILFWKQDRVQDTVGPKYFLRLKDSSLLERSHVFTGMQNRGRMALIEGKQWTSCLLIRVYHSKRTPRLGKKDKISHTHRVSVAENIDILTWGPFIGGMSDHIRYSMMEHRDVTLVAGGSAACYLLDALQMHSSKSPLTILYTARDEGVFSWVADTMRKLMPSTHNLKIIVALTNGGVQSDSAQRLVEEKRREMDSLSSCSSSHNDEAYIRLQYGRIDFLNNIQEDGIVYCQGSKGLQDVVKKSARMNRCSFVGGDAFDQDPNRQKNVFKRLRMKLDRRGTNVV